MVCQHHAQLWKLHLAHEDGSPGRHCISQKKQWERIGRKGMEVPSDPVACSQGCSPADYSQTPEIAAGAGISLQPSKLHLFPRLLLPGQNAWDRGGHPTVFSPRNLSWDLYLLALVLWGSDLAILDPVSREVEKAQLLPYRGMKTIQEGKWGGPQGASGWKGLGSPCSQIPVPRPLVAGKHFLSLPLQSALWVLT